MSLYKEDGTGEKDVSEAIPLWIEEGQTSSVHSYEGIHMMENMSKENLKIMQLLYLYLKNKGFDCVLVG